MIPFHNDHLVPSVLCEILYHTVPEELHIPVVFLRSPTDREPGERFLGAYFGCEPLRIEICLNVIFNAALRREMVRFGALPFREWVTLFGTCFHEFGHRADHYRDELSDAACAYSRREYANAESRAHRYARRMIAGLAESDKRLFQPRWLGYLSIRIQKWLAPMKSWESLGWSPPWQFFHTLRSIKAGGQLTTNDVAYWLGIYKDRRWKKTNYTYQIPDRALILRVASDLGHKYIDRAGRQHLFFDYGDLAEIARRIERRHFADMVRADYINPANGELPPPNPG